MWPPGPNRTCCSLAKLEGELRAWLQFSCPNKRPILPLTNFRYPQLQIFMLTSHTVRRYRVCPRSDINTTLQIFCAHVFFINLCQFVFGSVFRNFLLVIGSLLYWVLLQSTRPSNVSLNSLDTSRYVLLPLKVNRPASNQPKTLIAYCCTVDFTCTKPFRNMNKPHNYLQPQALVIYIFSYQPTNSVFCFQRCKNNTIKTSLNKKVDSYMLSDYRENSLPIKFIR